MKQLIILLALCWFYFVAGAQNKVSYGVNAGGGAINSFSYSLGTPLAQTGSTNNYTLLSGMHFPDDNFVLKKDSFNTYEIGDIPNQHIWLNNNAKFYVNCDSLGSDVAIHADPARTPLGTFTFDTLTHHLKYEPSTKDRLALPITFTAVGNGKIVKQTIQLIFNPFLPSEFEIFGIDNGSVPDEDSQDFITITSHLNSKDSVPEYFNNALRLTRKVAISGKHLVFKPGHQSTLENYSGDKTITDLYLFAEKITVGMKLELPQTNVHVFAKNIAFEDSEDETACIITTPPSIGTLPAQMADDAKVGNDGLNGLNGGNMELHILHIESSLNKRFVTCGAHGQAAGLGKNGARSDSPIPGGKPGNGGSAGNLISTLNLCAYSDMTGGSAGTKAPPTHNEQGGFAYAANADKMKGENGAFEEIEDKNSFLHPFGLRMILKHAKNSYVNYGIHYTAKIMTQYRDFIASYAKDTKHWAALSSSAQNELIELKEEMNLYLFRIGSNYDYFGNPAGWVPMLSFEINKAAFESETENAIDVLYLSYWIQNSYSDLSSKVAAMKESRNKQITNVKSLKTLYNANVVLIPGLRTERDEIQYQVEDIQERIVQKEKQLLDDAEDNVEDRKEKAMIKSVAKVAGSICMVVPGLQGVGLALNVAANVDFDDPLSTESLVDVGASIVSSLSSWESEANDIGGILDDLDFDDLSLESIAANITTLNKAAEKANLNLDDFKSIANSITVSDAEISQELERLKSQCVAYQELLIEEQALLERKKIFIQRIIETISTVTATANEIIAGLLGIDALNQSIQKEDFILDHRAMVYLKGMEQRAKDRLLKFHYFMSKAYEYRLLKPYTGQLDLSDLYKKFGTIAEASSGHALSKQDFESLKAIYEEQVSSLTDNILTEYNTNAPEVRSSMPYRLKTEQLKTLNATGKLTLNLYNEGFFQANEENIRITSLKIKSVEMEGEGVDDENSWAYSDILIYHSGISKLMKQGQTYYFNHYNIENKNPLVWGAKYDIHDGLKDHISPSPASQSLLSSILTDINKYSDNNMLVYSRPSAWANLRLEKTDNIQGGGKFLAKNLVLEIDYDYQIAPRDRINIFIESKYENGEKNSPNIIIDRTDNYERKDGQGNFTRNYFKNSTASVNVKTEKEYGESSFVRWEDQNGNILSDSTSVSVKLSDDIKLKSIYSNLPEDNSTSIDEINKQNNLINKYLKCYPNPIMDFLNVILLDNSITSLEVINLNGNILKKIEVSSQIVSIDLSNVSKGIYILRASGKQNNIISSMKIVKS